MKNSCFHVDAVLFDLDGTLIDSIESYYRIVEIVLEKMKFPVVSRKTILMAAKNDEFNWDMVLPDVPGCSKKETAAKAWKMIEKIYPEQFLKNVEPFPETANVIQQLFNHNIKIGIVTSTHKKNIQDKLEILNQAGISNLIETVVSNGDVERKKPFPDPLILCRDRMGFKSDQCVYVGDMGIDIAAGKAAGMKTIGILTGFETRKDLMDKQPDAIIESIVDLPGVLGI
jgi:phosphoglycolate phosphatase